MGTSKYRGGRVQPDLQVVWRGPEEFQQLADSARKIREADPQRWWLSKSMERKARLHDALAVALLLLLSAGLGVVVVLASTR